MGAAMRSRCGAVLLILSAAVTAVGVRAAELSADVAPPGSSTGAAASDAARSYFPDAILIDQHGKWRRFHSDLLEGKVVVIGAVATNCEKHCPQAFATWAEVEKKLGKRMGSEVRLISLATDPIRDSEDRMRELAKSTRAGNGWYFLTGPPASLKLVLAKLDMLPKEDQAHAGTWLIANVKTGLYKLGPDTMSAEQILEVVEECLGDR